MDGENPLAGDTVYYHLKVTLPEGWELEVPANLNFSRGFRPLKEEVTLRRKATSEGSEFDLRVPFVVVRIGRLKLAERVFAADGPAGEVGEVRAGRIVVVTGSHFASENEPARSDAEAPVPLVETNWLLVWVLVILTVVAAAVGITLLVLRNTRHRKPRPSPPPVPPHILALGALDELAALGLEKEGEFPRFYTRLSEILREYLGGRWEFDSMDLTTTELLATMEGVKLEHRLFQRLVLVLEDFDLVKFAKRLPSQTQAGEDLTAVRDFVTGTTAELSGTPASDSPATAGGGDR